MSALQKAFVLHSRSYRDNQQLVELITENEGKSVALVYVGQSKRSIKKGLLQPFLPLNVCLKSLGELQKIAAIESTKTSFKLTKAHLYSGFYLNELLVRLLPTGIHCPLLFEQYQTTLLLLSQHEKIAPYLRNFELCLLAELGLSFDFSCVYQVDASHFMYLPEQGFVPEKKQSEQGNAITNQAVLSYDKYHLQAISELIYENKAITLPGAELTFKCLIRQVINHLLGNKPLHSRKLFSSKC